MNIQFKPQDKNHPADRRASTNVGDFLPGEIRGVSESQEKEAKKLIDNGDFVETGEAPNSTEIAQALHKTASKASEKAAKADAKAEAAEAKKSDKK